MPAESVSVRRNFAAYPVHQHACGGDV